VRDSVARRQCATRRETLADEMDVEKQQTTMDTARPQQTWAAMSCGMATVGAVGALVAAGIAAGLPSSIPACPTTDLSATTASLTSLQTSVSQVKANVDGVEYTGQKPWLQRAYASVHGKVDAHYLSESANSMPIGYHAARLAESGDSMGEAKYQRDGKDGKTDWGFGPLAPIMTVGESDKDTGYAITGVPDGLGVMRTDSSTMRVIYQSESYGHLSGGRSWHQQVNQNGAKFTGSHVHFVDYSVGAGNGNTQASFSAGSQMGKGFAEAVQAAPNGQVNAMATVKQSGSVFDEVYNLRGEKVVARDGNNAVATGAHLGDTSADGHFVTSDKNDDTAVSENAWTFHSFCSAHLEEAEQWGTDMGVVDDMWITGEEWTGLDANATKDHGFVGLSAHVIDIATKQLHAVGAFGLGGWEKIVEFNCGDSRFTCFSPSGYNGNFGGSDMKTAIVNRMVAKQAKRSDGTDWVFPQNIVPARIYVGRKNVKADGTSCKATGCNFLERNGLAYGQVYGFTVATSAADRDAWHKGRFRTTNDFTVTGGWSKINWRFDPSNVKDIEHSDIFHWQDKPVEGTNVKFWNAAGADASGAKTEHNSPSPTGDQAFVQGSTAGYYGIYKATDLKTKLNALTGDVSLPTGLTGTYEMIEGESDIDDRVKFCNTASTGSCVAGQGKRADGGDQTLMNDGNDKKTFEDIDGLEWIVAKGTSTDKDETIGSDDVKHYFIIQEDGGNRFGERMFIARRPSGTAKADYHFVAQAGGAKNSRMLAGVSVPPRTFASAKASEFSGVADLSGVLTQATVGGAHRREAERKIDINDKTILIGLQQHSISAGVVSTFGQDRGGQVLAWDVDHVPN